MAEKRNKSNGADPVRESASLERDRGFNGLPAIQVEIKKWAGLLAKAKIRGIWRIEKIPDNK